MKLRSKLSLAFALVALLTVALICLLSNIFINYAFKNYVVKRSEQKAQEIISNISLQYNETAGEWNLDFVHAIGMYALYDGYIVKVTDSGGNVLWDAQTCDMATCAQVMSDITERMAIKCPKIKGKFTNREYPVSQGGAVIGTVNISYFGPYFLSDNDFHFLDALNTVLIYIGILSLVLSAAVGTYMSKRISDPVSKAAEAARKMSGGDFAARIDGGNSTKELSELVDSVNHLAESLSYQESLRKQLTADVSHELRTPVTSMQTHLEAMAEGIWEPTPERLASCYEEAARIGTLVKDLENLAQIDNNIVTLNKKTISLSRLWGKVIDSLEMDIKSKSLTVTVSGTVADIQADEDRLCQVAVNLLSNAVKYTPEGGRIEIGLSGTDKHAIFVVSDNGAGIPEKEQPFIFERFYRADKSRNRKTGGAGIGLAVVKSIVAAHGGTVKCESGMEHGSRFTVSLPK